MFDDSMTITCAEGRHGRCHGTVIRLGGLDGSPCKCDCHTTPGARYDAAN